MAGVLCGEAQRKALMSLLAADAVANTFLLADIELYGFDKAYQTVWANDEAKGPGVYLLFYDNLSVWARDPACVDTALVREILARQDVGCVMGRLEMVAHLAGVTGYTLGAKKMCAYSGFLFASTEERVQIATLADVDDIFAFLASIPSLAGLYASRDMIAGRIERGDGVHAIIRENGRIVAHANTAASSALTTMIGGAGAVPATVPCEEGRRAQVVRTLCQSILQTGRRPCTLCTEEALRDFWAPMGFAEVCAWGTLTRPMD